MSTTAVNNVTVNRVSFNGGEGGITARPTAREQAMGQQRHIPPVAAQTQHVQAARSNPQMRAEANQGKPPVAATSRPGEFSGRGVVAAKAEGAPYRPAPSHGGTPTAGRRHRARRRIAERPAEGNMSAPRNDNPIPPMRARCSRTRFRPLPVRAIREATSNTKNSNKN